MNRPPPTPLDPSRDDLEQTLARLGQPRYRVDQLLAWIHGRGVLDPAQMTDLPRALRTVVASALPTASPPPLEHQAVSADGTRRLVLRLADGASTETVLIPEDPADQDAADEDDGPGPPPAPAAGTAADGTALFTQCLSTQVGCAFRCAFCRSGTTGFLRHLSPGEILAQRHRAREALGDRGAIHRTVLMGIGEPLHNLEAVLAALRLLADPRAGGVSPRRITVSTVGLPEGIRALGDAFGGRMGLAWSLHAADEATRARLLPGMARRPVGEIVDALRAYPLPPRRRLTVECVLVRGLNDSPEQARAVVRLLAPLRVKLNLIPFNPWAGIAPDDPDAGPAAAAFEPPGEDRLEAYRRVLTDAGLSAFVRRPRGGDVLAACGQLLGRGRLSPAPRCGS